MVLKAKKQVRIDEGEGFWLNLSKPKPRTYPYSGYMVNPQDYDLGLEYAKPIEQEEVALAHSEEQRLREEARLEKKVESVVSEAKKNYSLDHDNYTKYEHEREGSFHHYADRSHHYHQLARINRYSSRKALLDYHMDHLLNIYGILMPKFTGGQDPELELYLQRLRTPSWALPEAPEASSRHEAEVSKTLQAAADASSRQASASASSRQVSSTKAQHSSSASSKSLSHFASSSHENLYRSYKLHRTQYRRAEYGRRY